MMDYLASYGMSEPLLCAMGIATNASLLLVRLLVHLFRDLYSDTGSAVYVVSMGR